MQGEVIRSWFDARGIHAAVAVEELEIVDGEEVTSRVEYNLTLVRTEELNGLLAEAAVPGDTARTLANQQAVVLPRFVEEFQRVYAEAHPQLVEIPFTGLVDLE